METHSPLNRAVGGQVQAQDARRPHRQREAGRRPAQISVHMAQVRHACTAALKDLHSDLGLGYAQRALGPRCEGQGCAQEGGSPQRRTWHRENQRRKNHVRN